MLAESIPRIELDRTTPTWTNTKLLINVSENFAEFHVIHLHRCVPNARKAFEPGNLILVCILVGDDGYSNKLKIFTAAGNLSCVANV